MSESRRVPGCGAFLLRVVAVVFCLGEQGQLTGGYTSQGTGDVLEVGEPWPHSPVCLCGSRSILRFRWEMGEGRPSRPPVVPPATAELSC